MFVAIVGGLVTYEIKTNECALKKDIFLNGYLGDNKEINRLPLSATLEGYILNIHFYENIEHVSIYVREGRSIIDMHEAAVSSGQILAIDVSNLKEGEYRLDIHDIANGYTGGFFFIE